MVNKPAALVLADGQVFEGVSIGADGLSTGELVFNTSMTGYQEMLTDPSYAHQLIVLTAAHIGNTGGNLDDMESSKIWAKGLLIRDCPRVYSNYRAEFSLPDWLKKHNIHAISGLDTRAITRHLRISGAMGACLTTDFSALDEAHAQAQSFEGLTNTDLASLVSRQTIERWHEGSGVWALARKPLEHHVVVYDFGVKHSILKILHDLGCHLTLVPAKTSAKEVLGMNPDGILLSNGPGDPKACDYAITATQTFLEQKIPLFGICLGFQILSLACGATTSKMKFGHHGANHPVQSLVDGRVFITSQNHGFMVDKTSLPDVLEATHVSLFDQSLQGIRHKKSPAFGFQGHPEASPGPHDINPLFDQFIRALG